MKPRSSECLTAPNSNRYLLTYLRINYQTSILLIIYDETRRQDGEEAVQKLTEVDSDKDGSVSWSEYALKVFGYGAEELAHIAADTDPALETFNKVYNVIELFGFR